MEACYGEGLPEAEVPSPILLSLPCKVWDELREPPLQLRPPAPAAPCPKATLKPTSTALSLYPCLVGKTEFLCFGDSATCIYI